MNRILMPTLGFIILLTFFTDRAVSQNVKTEYYNKNWQITNGDDKYYKREIIQQKDSLFLVKDYFLSDTIEMIGYYKSISNELKDGKFVFYYGNGAKHYEGAYCNGTICGEWKVFTKTGELERSVNYDFEIPECPPFDTSLNAYLKRDSLNYVVVDYMPRFISKTFKTFDEYVQANLFIPPLINKYKIKDRAEAQFTINSKGELCGIKVTSQTGNKTIIKEVCRVLINAPRWVPAGSNNIPVPMNYIMPVKIE